MAKLAVIPARSGSKRIPKKNVRLLAGKPMLAYTVEAALGSNVFDEVIVSTDSRAIADIAQYHGASVPFLRNASLADDHTPASLVSLDILEKLDSDQTRYLSVCQLMPNCPLRNAEDIEKSAKQFDRNGADTQLSVSSYGWLNPWWAFKLGEQQRLEPLFPEALEQRSQDLDPLYCPSGAIWWAKSKVLRAERSFHSKHRTGFELSWQHALDIDDESDWQMAELIFELQKR